MESRLLDRSYLHNVAEILSGLPEGVFGPEARARIASGQGNLGALLNEPSNGRWLSRIPGAVRAACNPGVQLGALEATGSEFRFVPDGRPISTAARPIAPSCPASESSSMAHA